MPHWATVLLRIASVCLFLGLAWIHLFWETPYEAVLAGRLSPEPVAHGIGLWLLFCGLVVIAWRPVWVCATVLFLSVAPLAVHAIAQGLDIESERDRIAAMASSAALVFTPLILMIGGRLDVRAGGIFLSRFTLTLSFATFALLAFGQTAQLDLPKAGGIIIGLPRPESWDAALVHLIPNLAENHQQLLWRCLAGATFFACVGIWFRVFTPPASLLLSLLGVAGITTTLLVNMEGDFAAQLHRWAPEAVMRIPLAILPIALWQMVVLRRRRKLKRVAAIAPNAADDGEADSKAKPKTVPGSQPAPEPLSDPNESKKRKKLKRID